MTKQRQYNIYLNKKKIDSVFYSLPDGYKTVNDRVESVKDSLINHDGYHPNIMVLEVNEN